MRQPLSGQQYGARTIGDPITTLADPAEMAAASGRRLRGQLNSTLVPVADAGQGSEGEDDPAEVRHTAREVRRMTEEGSKQTGEGHEVWLKCFVATLAGATRAVTTESGAGPEDTASICAAIADAAVEEERRRRPEVKWPR